MADDLHGLVQRMIDGGESEAAIASVIRQHTPPDTARPETSEDTIVGPRGDTLQDRLIQSRQNQQAITGMTLLGLPGAIPSSLGPAVGRLLTSASQSRPGALARATLPAVVAGAQEAPVVGPPLKAMGRIYAAYQQARPAAQAEEAARALKIATEGARPLESQTNLVLSPQAAAQERRNQELLRLLAKRQGTGYAARGALE